MKLSKWIQKRGFIANEQCWEDEYRRGVFIFPFLTPLCGTIQRPFIDTSTAQHTAITTKREGSPRSGQEVRPNEEEESSQFWIKRAASSKGASAGLFLSLRSRVLYCLISWWRCSYFLCFFESRFARLRRLSGRGLAKSGSQEAWHDVKKERRKRKLPMRRDSDAIHEHIQTPANIRYVRWRSRRRCRIAGESQQWQLLVHVFLQKLHNTCNRAMES